MVSYLKFAIILNAVDNFSKTFNKAARKAGDLGGKLRAFGDAISKVRYEIAGLAFVMAVDLIGQSAEAAAAMDRLARQAAAFAGGASASVQELTRIFNEFKGIMLDANRLQMFTPDQIGELLKFLALAGASSQEIDRMVDSVGHLAYATGTELADAGRITLNVMRAFGKETEDLGAISDALTVSVTSSMQTLTDLGQTMKYAAPSMSAAGRSLEEASAAAGLLANAGLKATQAGTALRQTVAQLLKPTDESLKLQSRYNLSLVELTPAALQAKESLKVMGRQTERLQDVIDRTQMDIKSLQYAMEELAIGTTENQLQIMSIRLRASKQGRELTTDELDRIKKLELANDLLSFEATQSQLDVMRLGHAASGASLGIDKLTQSEKEMAETARTGIKGIRPIEDILRELEKVGDDTAVIFELFGIRSATAVLALRNAMYEGETGADGYAKILGQVEAAAESATDETAKLYNFMATGAGAQLDILMSKQQTFMAQIGADLLPIYTEFKKTMVGVTEWMSQHSEGIGHLTNFLMKLGEVLGKVLGFLVKYPEILGVLIGYWITMKLAIPVKALISFVKWLRITWAAIRAGEIDLNKSVKGLDRVALAAVGVGAAIGGIISAWRMFNAESSKARSEAYLMTSAQWALSAAFFAVMVASMGAMTLGVAVPLGVAIALGAATALYAMAEHNAKLQKGGVVTGTLGGSPVLVGENFTTEAVIPLEHGAVPVEIMGGMGGGTTIAIDRIEVNVVDGDRVVEAVTEAVYDGVRRGVASG